MTAKGELVSPALLIVRSAPMVLSEQGWNRMYEIETLATAAHGAQRLRLQESEAKTLRNIPVQSLRWPGT